MDGLRGFLERVYARVHTSLDHPRFHEGQRKTLRAVLQKPARRAATAPLGDPLSVIYLIVKAHGRDPDVQVEHIAAFGLLHLLSADLFDDVQDDDLDGGPHSDVPLAINDAITLTFVAQDELRQGMALEPDAGRRGTLHEVACRLSLTAAAGQYRDLRGADGALSPEQVLAMHEAKTSSVQLLAECAALLARTDETEHARYREFGRHLAVFIQVRDDLRDIYGKAASPDLATGKISYPIACFLESEEADHDALMSLVAGLPETMPEVRSLLYRSGAVAQSARRLEVERRAMHTIVSEIVGHSGPVAAAPLRVILDTIDGLAKGIYAPPTLSATANLWRPATPWHRKVRRSLARFSRHMKPCGLPEPPALRPWAHPHWMYVPDMSTIFYPDVGELGDEVLAFQALLLGTDDLDAAREALEAQLPLVIAHEMFHFWRDASGRLTSHHWHEEWVANRLAVAHCAAREPSMLVRTRALCVDVVTRFDALLDDEAEAVLTASSRPPSEATQGYGMSMLQTAVVTLEMVRRLIDERPRWEHEAHLVAGTAAPPSRETGPGGVRRSA
ncbi:MAG: polyprenyl synthetase family protein [Myxococcota bacterium]